MTKEQVFELLQFINAVYPSFEITQPRIDTWASLFRDQDPTRVMKNAEYYVLEHKFPPSVADLREVKTEANNSDFLKKAEEWRLKASGGQPRS